MPNTQTCKVNKNQHTNGMARMKSPKPLINIPSSRGRDLELRGLGDGEGKVNNTNTYLHVLLYFFFFFIHKMKCITGMEEEDNSVYTFVSPSFLGRTFPFVGRILGRKFQPWSSSSPFLSSPLSLSLSLNFELHPFSLSLFLSLLSLSPFLSQY